MVSKKSQRSRLGLGEKTSDGLLSFGSIDGGVLNSVEGTMFKCYTPLLESKADWGKNNAQQTKDFLSGTDRFLSVLQTSLKNTTAGLALRKPDGKYESFSFFSP